MPTWLIAIVCGTVPSLISGVILWVMKQKVRYQESLLKRVEGCEKQCANCKATLLTEEKLRKILQEIFDQFELRLINEGRLDPRYTREER